MAVNSAIAQLNHFKPKQLYLSCKKHGQKCVRKARLDFIAIAIFLEFSPMANGAMRLTLREARTKNPDYNTGTSFPTSPLFCFSLVGEMVRAFHTAM